MRLNVIYTSRLRYPLFQDDHSGARISNPRGTGLSLMIQALHTRLHITFYMKTLIYAITFSVAEVNKFIDQGSVDINKIYC